jgi:hypothetical protein
MPATRLVLAWLRAVSVKTENVARLSELSRKIDDHRAGDVFFVNEIDL